MNLSQLQKYRDFTRYLKPVKRVPLSEKELVLNVLQYLDANDVVSCASLLGDRLGVFRLTLQTPDSVKKLEDVVRKSLLQVRDIPIGMVDENGQFFLITLDNVPSFIGNTEIESLMSKFGAVAGITKDYIEVKGKKIENERRRVLFTMLNDKIQIPKVIKLHGMTIFSQYRGADSCSICTNNSSDFSHGIIGSLMHRQTRLVDRTSSLGREHEEPSSRPPTPDGRRQGIVQSAAKDNSKRRPLSACLTKKSDSSNSSFEAEIQVLTGSSQELPALIINDVQKDTENSVSN